MKYLLKRILVSSLFIFCFPVAYADTLVSEVLSTQALIKTLQSGGHIIYMRHGMTDRKNADRNKKMVDFGRCETQRNLSAAGKTQVKEMGLMIKSLNIPIGEVTSSPYCRTKDTAQAVFGHFTVDENLAFSLGKVEEESAKLGKYLHDAMMSTKVNQQNTVFVGHTANLKDGLGIWPKPEGVAVIFKKSDDKIIYMGMIKPEQWQSHQSPLEQSVN
mgnify:CR=1 FL=1